MKIKSLFNHNNFIYTIALLLTGANANAQWISKRIDNGFDDPVNLAYVVSTADDRFLKLEQIGDGFESRVMFYLGGEYYCGDGPVYIEFSFQVNGQNKKYTRQCELFHIDDDNYALISNNFTGEDFISAFKACTTLKIRINDFDCPEGNVQTIYTFKMSGSTAALNFVSKI